jgi:hypothetical protein
MSAEKGQQEGMSRRDLMKTSTLAAGALAVSGFVGQPPAAQAAGRAWEQVGHIP